MEITNEVIDNIAQFFPGSFAILSFKDGEWRMLKHSADRPYVYKIPAEQYQKFSIEEFLKHVMPSDQEQILKNVDRCVKKHENAEATYRLINKATGFTWMHSEMRYIGDMLTTPCFIVYFAANPVLTDLIDKVIENTTTLVLIVDTKTHEVLFANKAARSFSGQNSSSSGSLCYSFLHKKSSLCENCYLNKLKEEDNYATEIFDKESGKYFHLTFSKIDWYGRNAAVVYLDDETPNKTLQLKLEEEKDSFAKTIDSIPCGIAVFEKKNGVIRRILVNKYTEEIKGVSKERLESEDFNSLFNRVWPSEKEMVIQNTKDVFTKGEVSLTYRTLNPKTNEFVWMSRRGISLTKADGSMLGFFSYFEITNRIKMEEIIKEQKERYQLAISSANMDVWEYDVLSHKIITNRGGKEYARSVDEFEHFISHLNSASGEKAQENTAFKKVFKAIEEGDTSFNSAEYVMYLPQSGETRHVKSFWTIVFDDNHKPLKGYGINVDKTVEYMEKESYEREMQDLLTTNPNALCAFRLNLTKDSCIHANESSIYISRVLSSNTAEGFLGKLKNQIIDENGRAEMEKHTRLKMIEDFDQGHKRFNITYQRYLEDGLIHWVTTFFSLIKNPLSQDIEAAIFSVDSDEVHKEQAVIQKVDADYYDFIAIVNIKTNKIQFHSINENAKDIQAICNALTSYQEMMSNYFSLTMEKDKAEATIAQFEVPSLIKRIDTDGIFSSSISVKDEKGLTKIKQFKATYLDSSKSDLLITRADITKAVEEEQAKSLQLQKALDSAKKANQLKTDFLANVSHDMRTPLNGVIGYTQLALQSNDDKVRQDYLLKIKESSLLLLSLINDTLDLSKIETGETKINLSIIAPEEIVNEVITSVRPTIDYKKIKFTVKTSSKLDPWVYMDTQKVQEIFNNIISNAVKFTPVEGEIKVDISCVKTEEDYSTYRIIVQDNGVGMSQSFLNKAFEPFSQERNQNTRNIPGSGLGLSIVKKLVTLLKGTIHLESKEGQGTKVTVELPFKKSNDSGQTKQNNIKDYSLDGISILLVDDNQMNTEIAKTILEQKGSKVIAAQDGEEAIKVFEGSKEGSFDVILMDIRMPGMNGFEASKAIRSLMRKDAKSVPIIAMSADAYSDDIKRALAAGMDSYITKPVDVKKMCEEIARLAIKTAPDNK
ncbi:MAG: response regulator [Bacilli bacterium]|jgi:signal transduction histidine kinase/ActR/RegA family two-component response regulator/PAS domain-containing protein|nr:response regulator [Bacilli bacterium]